MSTKLAVGTCVIWLLVVSSLKAQVPIEQIRIGIRSDGSPVVYTAHALGTPKLDEALDLLFSDDVQEEVELIESQHKAWMDCRSKYLDLSREYWSMFHAITSPAEKEEIAQRVERDLPSLKEEVENILLSHQIERLRQIHNRGLVKVNGIQSFVREHGDRIGLEEPTSAANQVGSEYESLVAEFSSSSRQAFSEFLDVVEMRLPANFKRSFRELTEDMNGTHWADIVIAHMNHVERISQSADDLELPELLSQTRWIQLESNGTWSANSALRPRHGAELVSVITRTIGGDDGGLLGTDALTESQIIRFEIASAQYFENIELIKVQQRLARELEEDQEEEVREELNAMRLKAEDDIFENISREILTESQVTKIERLYGYLARRSFGPLGLLLIEVDDDGETISTRERQLMEEIFVEESRRFVDRLINIEESLISNSTRLINSRHDREALTNALGERPGFLLPSATLIDSNRPN